MFDLPKSCFEKVEAELLKYKTDLEALALKK
jgi:hypothetical protein